MSVVGCHGHTCTAGCDGRAAPAVLVCMPSGMVNAGGTGCTATLNPGDNPREMEFCCLHPLPDRAQCLWAARSLLSRCPDGFFLAASVMLWCRWPCGKPRSRAREEHRPVLGHRVGCGWWGWSLVLSVAPCAGRCGPPRSVPC